MNEINPYFQLKQVPIQTNTGTDIPGKFALQHGQTGNVFSVVSNRYKPTLNKEVNDRFDNVFEDMGIKVKTTTNHLDPTGKKWKQHRILEDFDMSVAPKDSVGVMVEIFNGYDGLTAMGFKVLGFRYACTNGLITGKALMMEFTVKHLTRDFEKLINEFQNRFMLFQKNTEIWKSWNETPFTQKQFVELVEDADYMGERLQKKLVEYYPLGIAKFDMERTVWGSYNVVTDFATHHTSSRRGSNVFANATKQLNRLAGEFYKLDTTPKVPLLTM